MKFSRLVVTVAFIGILLIYLGQPERMDEQTQWALVGAMVICAVLWVLTGEKPMPTKRPLPKRDHTPETSDAPEKDDEIDAEESDSQETEPDIVTLRERKLAKLHQQEQQDNPEDEQGDLTEISIDEIEVEDVHVADSFSVEISAQSIEDAEIDIILKEKNDHHQRIKERIESRRRRRLAEVRASTAKMWESHAAGEDILALLSKEGHGQTVIVEPSSVEAGGLYGATFIRLDGETILKLRTPLNEGFRVIEEDAQDDGLGLPDLPLPPGSLPPLGDLPPLPLPQSGMPPLPPPPLPSSSALSTLREEIEND